MQYRQAPPQPGDPFPEDRIAGWTIVGLAALSTLVQVLLFVGVVWLVEAIGKDEPAATRAALKGFMGVLVIINVVVAAINVFIGYGITRSAKWAFIAGLVLNTLVAVSNFALTLVFEDLATLATIMIAVYCGLRLFGQVGPRPG